jgi:hypothetical protein
MDCGFALVAEFSAHVTQQLHDVYQCMLITSHRHSEIINKKNDSFAGKKRKMIAEQNVKIVTLLKKSMCRNKFQ